MPQGISGSAQDTRGSSLTWLWLLVGFALLPFTMVQTMLPLAAWLAPIFLLRFARIARRTWLALTLIFLAQAISKLIAIRGGEFEQYLFDCDCSEHICTFRGTGIYAAIRCRPADWIAP